LRLMKNALAFAGAGVLCAGFGWLPAGIDKINNIAATPKEILTQIRCIVPLG
jgi:hypothetical protein